jgi:hypothetical protein
MPVSELQRADQPFQEYLPLLHELQGLYPSLATNPPPWRDGYRNVGLLAHGWYMRCQRSLEAVIALGDAGYGDEAAPTRRSVIEHCLALRWLAVEGDKILDTIARGHSSDVKYRAKALRDAGWKSVNPADLQKIIDEIDPDSRDRTNDNLLQFAHRLAKYGDQHTLPGYIAETAKSHPTYESAMSYIAVPNAALRSLPRENIWQVPFATTHLLEALIAVREAFEPQPWELELEDIIMRYLAVTDRVREHDGLPPVDWSTGKLIEYQS